jgi:2-polyprenyl-3-methyl-5-hydroxy-6-metoxy-1,4-benzoquinol methylase
MHFFNEEYFASYETKGRFIKRERGNRQYQFRYWLNYMSRHFVPASRVLEIGCGLGYFGSATAGKFEYAGNDISLYALHSARERDPQLNLVQSDATSLGFSSESFDIVFAFDILEHIVKPGLVVSEAYRVLRKKGRMIVTTPNTKSLGNRTKTASGKLVPSMYKDKTHVSLLNVDEWEKLFKKSGFTISRVASDTLWDIPYSKKIPFAFQKFILIPFNILISYYLGGLPWSLGENLIFICEK